MQKREKNLALVTGFLMLLLFGAFGVRNYLLEPLRKIDQATVAAKIKLDELRELEAQALLARDRLKQLASRTYSDDPNEAAALSGTRLAQLIEMAGLNDRQFIRTPAGHRRVPGGHEIGWNLRGRGSIEKVVDFLFLLHSEPTVAKVESMTLVPTDARNELTLQLRYLTLVVDAVTPDQRLSNEPAATLAQGGRRLYQGILTRDLFRPYVKRPPSPPPPPAPVAPVLRASSPPSEPGPESYRIVSLSEWQGRQEVHVYDITTRTTQRYVIGDDLAGGRIVMIDYRTLPLPGDSLLESQSRMILKIEDRFWAVERGQTLADKYEMPFDQLPIDFKEEATISATAATSNEDGATVE